MSIDRGLRGVALGFVRSVLDLFAPISLLLLLFLSLCSALCLSCISFAHLSLSTVCTYSVVFSRVIILPAALVNPS